MFDLTPQERLALIVLSLLLTGGALARHALGRADRALAVQFSAEAADTLNPELSGALREGVEAEVAEAQARSEPLGRGEKIDPNTASAVQLDRLPGIGPALADRIVAHRSAHGRFRTLAELGEVPGIGDVLLGRIAPQLTLTRGTPAASRGVGRPIDINRASVTELQELTGIGPAIAERIVAHRTANGRFRRWEDLEKVSGIGPRLRERLQASARLEP